MTPFTQSVYRVVKKIPQGKTMTYREVARVIGKPRAYRAVASALAQNFDPAIPCHRVIRSDGGLGGYNRGVKKKRELLMKEKAL